MRPLKTGEVLVRTRAGVVAPGSRVCWTGVPESCATAVIAPAEMLAPVRDALSTEQAASLAHAGITARLLARVWRGWLGSGRLGVAGAVGRMLATMLADRDVPVPASRADRALPTCVPLAPRTW